MIKIKIKEKKIADKVLYTEVNLKLNSGIYILKGDNGVGKTTLLNTLYKEDEDYLGNISINDIDIRDYQVEEYRNNVCTYITQNNNLFVELKIKENLDLLVAKENEDKLNELLTILNFTEIYNKNNKYKKLSGGEKQKLKIIIGLLEENPIILIDEIENNLDLESINKINDYLIRQEKLIIISSHNLMSENNLPNIIIEDKKIRLENQIKEINQENNLEILDQLKKELNKNKIKELVKINKFSRGLLGVVFFIFILISSLVLVNIKSIYDYSNIIDEGLYGEKSSLVYAPIFNDKFDAIGEQSWLKSTPAYFTDKDLEELKNQEYIKNIIPIGDNNKILQYEEREDGKVVGPNIKYGDLNYEKYNLKNYQYQFDSDIGIKASYLLSPNVVNENSSEMSIRTSDVKIEKVLYGSLPKENTDKVMIDIYYAMYLANENGIDNLEELIDSELKLQLKTAPDDNVAYSMIKGEPEEEAYSISGIYLPYKLSVESNKTSVVYPYDSSLEIVQNNNTGIKHPKMYYGDVSYLQFTYDQIKGVYEGLGSEYISLKEYENIYPQDLYYSGFYVEVEKSEDLEKLTKDIAKYDPYIEIKNNYVTEQGKNYSLIKDLIINRLIILFIIIVLYVLIIFMLLKYYKLLIQSSTKILEFYAYDQKNINQYINAENKLINKLIIMLTLVLCLIGIFISVFIIAFYTLITIFTILIIKYHFKRMKV